MFVYLTTLVDGPRPGPKGATGPVPLGVDLLDPATLSWSRLSFSGFPQVGDLILLGSQTEILNPPKGCDLLAAGKDDTIPDVVLAKMANAVGENVDLGVRKVPSSLAAYVAFDTRSGKRNLVLPARQADGSRRHEVWLGGEKVYDVPVIAGGAVEFTDNFNRANSSTVGGSFVEDGAGDWSIASNQLSISLDGDYMIRHTGDISSLDHYAQIDIPSSPAGQGGVLIRLRVTALEDYSGYQGGVSPGYGTGWNIIYFNRGSWSGLVVDQAGTPSYPATIRFRASGSTLTISEGGVDKAVGTDPDWTGVRAGVGCWPASGTRVFDNFESGTPTAAVTVSSGPIRRRSPSIKSPQGLRNRRTPFALLGARSGTQIVNVSVGSAAATAAGSTPIASVAPNGGSAAATATASTPVASVKPSVGLGSATGTASAPSAAVSPNGGRAAATGTASTPTASVGPSAGSAASTATSSAPTAAVSPSAGSAAATGTAPQPVASVAPNLGAAAATATASQPTVSTSASTTVNVGSAAATAGGFAPTAAVSPSVGRAAATASGSSPAASVSPSVGSAASIATAYQPGVSVAVNVGSASATTSGYTVTLGVSPVPGSASATASAYAPTVWIEPTVGSASATATAYLVTASGSTVSADATPYRTEHDLDGTTTHHLVASSAHALKATTHRNLDGTEGYELEGRRIYRRRP